MGSTPTHPPKTPTPPLHYGVVFTLSQMIAQLGILPNLVGTQRKTFIIYCCLLILKFSVLVFVDSSQKLHLFLLYITIL